MQSIELLPTLLHALTLLMSEKENLKDYTRETA